jgi:hypothetical protein
MSDEQSRQAAAFAGIASNRHYSLADRLGAALKALEFYERFHEDYSEAGGAIKEMIAKWSVMDPDKEPVIATPRQVRIDVSKADVDELIEEIWRLDGRLRTMHEFFDAAKWEGMIMVHRLGDVIRELREQLREKS